MTLKGKERTKKHVLQQFNKKKNILFFFRARLTN